MPEQKCILHHLGASLQSVRVPWVKKIYEQILVTQLWRGETDCICCMSCTLSFFCLDDEGILHCNIQYISIRKIPRWDYLETRMNPPFPLGTYYGAMGKVLSHQKASPRYLGLFIQLVSSSRYLEKLLFYGRILGNFHAFQPCDK